MIELYDYQKELVEKARNAYKDGYKAPCIVAPCGAGKSVMIAEIVRLATSKKQHVLFLVHRKELLEQIENTLKHNDVDMEYVTLGMVMTVVRRLDKYPHFDLIVVDENHHTLANSYKKILEYFNTRIIGFTATPVRLNGDGLGEVNDILIETVNAKWLIENNRLANYNYYTIDLIDRKALKKSSTGDYTSDSMDKAIGATIFGDVIYHYQKLIDGQRTIVYAHSIEYSKMFAEQFNEAGIPAAHIDGTTNKSDRKKIINDFRNGVITVLCNVDLIGEGFDVPDCTAVMLLRPTESLSLHIQQSMRPMRYKPGKVATIIDHVGNVYVHGHPDLERKWTLEKKKKRKREEVDPYPTWTCEQCYFTLPKEDMKGKDTCPNCGFRIEIERNNDKVIDKTVQLSLVTKEELTDWTKATSYKQLVRIAKMLGYKSSWAAFKAKDLHLKDTPRWVYQYKPKTLNINF